MIRAVRFVKVEGAGNDYVLVDAFEQEVHDPAALSRRVADRHHGIGSDGLLVVGPAAGEAAALMRIFNADGSEGRMCGNGLRCVVRYLIEAGRAAGPEVVVDTASGPLAGRLLPGERAEIVMGVPDFRPESLPVDLPGGGREPACHPLPDGLEGDGAWAVSTGNPHLVVGVPDADALDLAAVGRALETSPRLAEGANVHLVTVEAADRLRVRPWERGSGATRACGTGAVASAAVAWARGWVTADELVVAMPGGELGVRREPSGTTWLSGPARLVFRGEWPDEGSDP